MSAILVILVYSALSCTLPGVFGYYCNHDLCREDQYCCGDNLCCDYVYSLWYFWCGIAFLIILLMCGGIFRYCYYGNSYVILQTCKADYYPSMIIEEDGKNLRCVIGDVEDPPPPYPESQYINTYERCVPSGAVGRPALQQQHNPDLLVHFN